MDRKFMFLENNLTPGGCLPLPWGYIHVYDHNVQTSTSLKPLCQIKPNFFFWGGGGWGWGGGVGCKKSKISLE